MSSIVSVQQFLSFLVYTSYLMIPDPCVVVSTHIFYTRKSENVYDKKEANSEVLDQHTIT